MTTDCVLDLISLTQNLVELEKLMADRYKKILLHKIKVSAKINQLHKKISCNIYFPAKQRLRNTLH